MTEIDRRELLRRATALASGLGMGAAFAPTLAAADPAPQPAIRRMVRLGRTGLEISDVGFGTSRLAGDEALVRRALDRGVTYFDTAEGYKGGEAERTLGRVLGTDRNRIVLASKVQDGRSDTRDELMSHLEGSLGRLATDRIDIYFQHAVNDVRRLENDEWLEFATRAKQQGKIRFTGLSGHGGRLVECIDRALDTDHVDVVLAGYNFGQDPAFYERFTGRFDFIARQPELPRVLARAKEKKVGVVAMKTLRGARLNDMRPYEGAGATFGQAALRWTLASAFVDAAIITMKSLEQVDEYVGASGWDAPHPADAGLLTRYARRAERSQCRYGCAECEGACPAEVEISQVLRTRMYAADYGDLEFGREGYAALQRDAAPCLSCNGAPCATACPHGVSIPALLRSAGRMLG
ncbi:MAG: aldo/keto reductase [Deltaproteobacteria bacterium]|nr:aldo/keto reductase [Deltaproteobacteria bacterium]MBW2393778.1 aldo/keto reductase [Deltaproteobacteria bacterium]